MLVTTQQIFNTALALPRSRYDKIRLYTTHIALLPAELAVDYSNVKCQNNFDSTHKGKPDTITPDTQEPQHRSRPQRKA